MKDKKKCPGCFYETLEPVNSGSGKNIPLTGSPLPGKQTFRCECCGLMDSNGPAWRCPKCGYRICRECGSKIIPKN